MIFLFLAVAAAVVMWIRTGPFNKVQPGEFKDYNLLFITMDTTRADHLHAYGYADVKTPALDALAADSFVFLDAISEVPLTLPSHVSMMTGRLPIAHGVRDNSGFFLSPSETTLAEIFKTRGYATSAFLSAFVLESRWKLDQGFDLYYDNFNLSQLQDISPRDVQRRGQETADEAIPWMRQNRDKHFFSWVHLYDPHDPYDPPEPYKTEYAQHLYDGEIAYTDAVIGRILKNLEDLGLKDRTIVVVAGDHGEGLGEHSEESHSMFVYNTTLHVPLFIHLPGAGGRRIPGVVSLVDIAPTLLECMGMGPPGPMNGTSLLPKMNGVEKAGRIAYSESLYPELHYGWSPFLAITTDEYKYIKAPRPELFDRKNDPAESKNLIEEKAAVARVLDEKLEEMVKRYAGKNQAGPQKMDPETEEKLKALGYIGNTVTATEESRKIDPKDKVQLAMKFREAFAALKVRSYQRAADLLESVLQEDPNMVDARFELGVAYIGLEQYDRAIDALLRTLAIRPDHLNATYNLGYIYELRNDNLQAEEWYRKVLNIDPENLHANLKLAHLYRRENKAVLARPLFLKVVDFYRSSIEKTQSSKSKASLCSALGEIYFGAGEIALAEETIKKAIQLDPKAESLHYNLAQIYEGRGDLEAAIEEYKKEIENGPNIKALNDLGILYKELRVYDQAILCFQRLMELDPAEPRGYILLAKTYEETGRAGEAEQVIRLAHQRGVDLRR